MLARAFQIATLFLVAVGVCSANAADESIAQHQRWVTAIAFDADGKVLATAGGESLQYRPGDVKLWDAASGSLLATLEGHDSNVWSIAISADGNTVIASAYNGKVIVWNVAEKKAVATLDKHKGWCRSVAITPDGTHFASAGEDGTVVIWAVDGAKEVKSLKAHDGAVFQLAFSPDGKTLATASTDKTVKLWDWNAGKETGKLEGHEDAVWSVSYSPDGARIATSGADRTVRIWDASGKHQGTLRGHRDWVTSARFSPDGKTLASSSHDRSVKLWDVEVAIKLAGEADAAAQKLQASRDALAAAAEAANSAGMVETLKKKADALQVVLAFKLAESKQNQVKEGADKFKDNDFLKKALDEATKATQAAKKASDEKQKAVAGDKPLAEQLKKLAAGKIEDTQKAVGEAAKAATEMEAKVKNADQQKAAAEKGIADAQKQIKEIAGKQARDLAEHNSSVWAVAFSPNGALLASGSHKDSLRVWQLDGMKELFPRPVAEEGKSEGQAE